ncbi:MAG TPA: hypothetical protein VK612_07450 [Pyrinomonadaceae bacterium]|nr:hypothetical protein [Pyrinomonadaceae bacterium]
MYPRSKFQEVLLEIRQEMAREADFDVDLFAEIVRTGSGPQEPKMHAIVETENEDAVRPKPSSKRK